MPMTRGKGYRMTATRDQARRALATAVQLAPARRSKYHARPVVVDGIRFASTREATRYGELTYLVRAGQITDLTLQPEFPLHAPGLGPGDAPCELVGKYRADFAYRTADGTVVEDVKGVRTALYRWKKKHVEAEYGVTIVEV